jgi:hypothetical protein
MLWNSKYLVPVVHILLNIRLVGIIPFCSLILSSHVAYFSLVVSSFSISYQTSLWYVSHSYQPNIVSWRAEIVKFMIMSPQVPVTFFVLDNYYCTMMAPVNGKSSLWHATVIHTYANKTISVVSNR